MLRRIFTTPRSPEPLPAVLAGAGFFVFLAALTGLGPFAALDRALWRASLPGEAQVASQSALRVLGRADALSGAAKAESLAADLAWLRKEGAGAILVEAWLDEAPQSDARELAAALHERFQFLPPAAKRAALAALSETAAGVDTAPRLAAALGAAQPLVLAWQAVPGSGSPLPPALRAQGYEVTLRGQRQRLPELQPIHLPYSEALGAVARSGACAARSEDGRLPAVVEMQGRWFNALGLEGARLALGLPLEGLRYRWRKGVLSSLELKGVRYPLDAKGRILLPEQQAALPVLEMARLRSDSAMRERIRGRAVFFRPWPRQLGDAEAFEDQARLFGALVERTVFTPPAAPWRRTAWVAAWAVGVLGLGLLPAWAAILAWALLPLGAMQAFWAEPQSLAQPLVLAVSALCLGLGWRLQRRRNRLVQAEQELRGMVAPRHQDAWKRRLQGGEAGLESAYAVLGPRRLLQGAAWEAWMTRWGGYLDLELSRDAHGVVFAGPEAGALAVAAIFDLRQKIEGVAVSLAFGGLAFEARQNLGRRQWMVSGPSKDLALQLALQAKAGQCLILENDYISIRNLVKVQVLGKTLEAEGASERGQVLNLLALSGKL